MGVTRECVTSFVLCGTLVAGVLSAGTDYSKEAARFQEVHWATTRSLGDVDLAIIRALKSRFGRDDRLADRGDPFDATDVLAGKPRRRLVLAGHAERQWFVAYEVGGRGHHLVLAVFDTAQPPTPIMLARGNVGAHDDVSGWHLELADLQDGVKDGRLSIDDPNQPYY
jgi:hypothetical protein